MKLVNVATLKSRISEYLGAVEKGEELVVTSHNHPIARVIPYSASSKLKLRPPKLPIGRLKKLRGVQPAKPVDPVALLAEERRRR